MLSRRRFLWSLVVCPATAGRKFNAIVFFYRADKIRSPPRKIETIPRKAGATLLDTRSFSLAIWFLQFSPVRKKGAFTATLRLVHCGQRQTAPGWKFDERRRATLI